MIYVPGEVFPFGAGNIILYKIVCIFTLYFAP